MLRQVPLGSSSNPSRHGPEGAARLINCYVEDAGPEGKARWPIYASDGLSDFAMLPNGGAVRAAIEDGPDLYVVAGRLVYRVDASGAVTTIGGIPTDGMVTMASNGREIGNQILVASDGFYGVIEAGLFSEYSATGFRGPNSVAVLDGYGIAAAGEGYWQTSEQYNARSWDALEFANAESNADEIVRSFSHERELMLFGAKSIEWFQNVGNLDFPFARVTTKQIGCASGDSVAYVGDTLAWVDDENQVRVRNGYGGQIVSNGAVSRAIADLTDKTTIKGFGWARGNHAFYAIRCASWCWVFDLMTGQWHERRTTGFDTWNVSTVVPYGSKLIAGDATTGKLYEMSPTIYEDAGTPLVMTIQPPIVHDWPNPIKVSQVYMDVIPGVGAISSDTDDSEPQVMFRWSLDGGLNWSGQRSIPIGRLGARLQRIRARRLGRSQEDGFTFQVSISANVIKGITGMAIEAEGIRG